MYSAVLMLALTAGSETADFGRHGCSGCVGSCGGVVVSGGCHGARRSHGCCGGVVVASCHGGHACHGGGLFARRHSCHGGACYGSTGACYGSTGACYGSGVIIVPGAPGAPMEKKTMPKGEPVPAPKKAQVSVPATILVSLPVGARLIVDGTPTTSTAAQRTLVTPGLEVGTNYVYTMRAEFVSEGRTLAQTQQVNVRGGETSTVRFDFSTQGVASR
jgi:uncharacterized protein (TIGR03000 family)